MADEEIEVVTVVDDEVDTGTAPRPGSSSEIIYVTEINNFTTEVYNVVSDTIIAGDNVTVTPNAEAHEVTVAVPGLDDAAFMAVDTDTTLAADSASLLPTQHAVKTYVDGIVAGYLRSDTTANLTAGYTETAYDAGTQTTGTFTPDPANGNIQRVINGGAHTLAPPSVGSGDSAVVLIRYLNNISAGAVTTSGFDYVEGSFSTTDADEFLCVAEVVNGTSRLSIENITSPPAGAAVTGPVSSTDSRLAAFDGTGGDVLKDSGYTAADVLARANHTGTQAASTISDFSEAVDDRVNGLLRAGTNITLTYDDSGNSLTVTAADSSGTPVASGADYKDSVRVRVTSVTLASPGATLDGVTMSSTDPDRFLLDNGLATAGIYDWNGAAVPATRSVDADTDAEVTSGMLVSVTEGTSAGKLYQLTTPDPITIDTTALTFSQVAAPAGSLITFQTINYASFTAGNLNITNSHQNKRLVINNGSNNVTLTISASLMSNNAIFQVFRGGTGTVTLVASGVTIRSPGSILTIPQYAMAQLQRRTSVIWDQSFPLYQIGLDVQAYDANTIKSNVSANLTKGFTASAYSAGTKSSGTFTPDPANGNLQYATNGGAHTLAPPSTGSGNALTMVIQYTNNGSAGAITTSGFTKVSGSFTTTNGDDFMCYIAVLNGFSHLNIVALQ